MLDYTLSYRSFRDSTNSVSGLPGYVQMREWGEHCTCVEDRLHVCMYVLVLGNSCTRYRLTQRSVNVGLLGEQR